MTIGESEEITLLREIRDLLRPVADAYQDAYDRRQAEREDRRMAAVQSLIGTSTKRRRAWQLADGESSQTAIAKASGMDNGNLSRFFKALRELGAVEGDPPKRTMEVQG